MSAVRQTPNKSSVLQINRSLVASNDRSKNTFSDKWFYLGSKNKYKEYLLWQIVTVACIHFRSSEKTHLYTNDRNKPNIHGMVSLVYLALLTILFFHERKFMESFCYILHLVPFEKCHSSLVKIYDHSSDDFPRLTYISPLKTIVVPKFVIRQRTIYSDVATHRPQACRRSCSCPQQQRWIQPPQY